MARLEDLRQSFTPLTWAEKLAFIEDYRSRRYNDLHTIQEFNLAGNTAKPKKVREKKEATVKKPRVAKQKFTAEQLDLLAKLGLA